QCLINHTVQGKFYGMTDRGELLTLDALNRIFLWPAGFHKQPGQASPVQLHDLPQEVPNGIPHSCLKKFTIIGDNLISAFVTTDDNCIPTFNIRTWDYRNGSWVDTPISFKFSQYPDFFSQYPKHLLALKKTPAAYSELEFVKNELLLTYRNRGSK